ncbi:NAD(P)-binding protein [Mollisia scopiformis]|uniref:NAD(P)-binding protein n=1 Tax=Mollisia scopiformis TaxID=149040 RepID=A0A194XU40_MOLSC|nr:NAD(P)-binding protein [Mollisia scopiformis]KUJ23656.1 NAD(P)-binding protein [Mollisia scopiformis]
MSSPSSQTILITGASGFVASHIIHAFLEAGYKVRGTVRSSSSIEKVKAAQGPLSSNLTFYIVPDLASPPSAYAEAIKGVSGVIHTASPFILTPKDVRADLLEPAINGTTNVLKAAAEYAGPQLKRVVITSSFASIFDLSKGYRPGYVYTEKDWNPATYDEAANSTDGSFAYCASKPLAEHAAWNWMSANPEVGFTLATICPPWVFGPSLNTITNLGHLNESTETIWKLINGSSKTVPPIDFGGFADVRTNAQAHLKAYEKDEAAGERFLVGQHFDYQSAADAIREAIPELRGRVSEGTPGSGLDFKDTVYTPDGSKAEKVLGIKYIDLKKCMVDTAADLLAAEKRLGWKAE